MDNLFQRSWLVFIRIQATTVVLILLAIVLVTLANVLLRFLGPGSLTWADEFARVFFVMFSFLAAALACGFGAHLVVDGIVNKATGIIRTVIHAFQALVAGVFFLTIVVIGYMQTLDNLGQRTPAIDFPVGVMYGAVSFSGVLMLVNSLMASALGAVSVHAGRLVLGEPEELLEEVA